VHSNEQIIASREFGGRSQLQHSQFGFMSSMAVYHLSDFGSRLCENSASWVVGQRP
jgi:hypothetical protein